MIGTRTRQEWEAVSRDPVQTVRALADWTADILTVMRLVSGAAGMAGLADSKPGTAYYHAEQVRHWLVERATGGMTHTDITPELVARWVGLAADRTRALSLLADELGGLLVILNAASGGNAGLWALAASAEGGPYWHAGRAHQHVLALLAGNREDGYLLHELWSDNQESTQYNLALLQQTKEDTAVVVRVAADGDSATITTPGSIDPAVAGRTEGSGGLFWVTALGSDDVIGHEPSWAGVGHLVARYHNYPEDTRVIVDYSQPAAEASPHPDSTHTGSTHTAPHTARHTAHDTAPGTVGTDTTER